MGQRISIDSATMFNKALEVIEAHHLFDFSAANIKVAIHPQSLVHGMIELADGSMQADISQPDMKLPISYALQYPDPNNMRFEKPPFSEMTKLEFLPVEGKRYPVFQLGCQVIKRGHGLGAVINAVDEEAVKLFLQKKIRFTNLAKLVTKAAHKAPRFSEIKIDDIWEADRWGREFIESQIKNSMKCTAIILAVGEARRTKLGYNKLFYNLKKSLLAHTLTFFQESYLIDEIIIVANRK